MQRGVMPSRSAVIVSVAVVRSDCAATARCGGAAACRSWVRGRPERRRGSSCREATYLRTCPTRRSRPSRAVGLRANRRAACNVPAGWLPVAVLDVPVLPPAVLGDWCCGCQRVTGKVPTMKSWTVTKQSWSLKLLEDLHWCLTKLKEKKQRRKKGQGGPGRLIQRIVGRNRNSIYPTNIYTFDRSPAMWCRCAASSSRWIRRREEQSTAYGQQKLEDSAGGGARQTPPCWLPEPKLSRKVSRARCPRRPESESAQKNNCFWASPLGPWGRNNNASSHAHAPPGVPTWSDHHIHSEFSAVCTFTKHLLPCKASSRQSNRQQVLVLCRWHPSELAGDVVARTCGSSRRCLCWRVALRIGASRPCSLSWPS